MVEKKGFNVRKKEKLKETVWTKYESDPRMLNDPALLQLSREYRGSAENDSRKVFESGNNFCRKTYEFEVRTNDGYSSTPPWQVIGSDKYFYEREKGLGLIFEDKQLSAEKEAELSDTIQTAPALVIEQARMFWLGFFQEFDHRTVDSLLAHHSTIERMAVDPRMHSLIDNELLQISFKAGDVGSQSVFDAADGFSPSNLISQYFIGGLGSYSILAALLNEGGAGTFRTDQGEVKEIRSLYNDKEWSHFIGYTNYELGVYSVVSNMLILYFCVSLKDKMRYDGLEYDVDTLPDLMQYFMGLTRGKLIERAVEITNYFNLLKLYKQHIPRMYDDVKSEMRKGQMIAENVIKLSSPDGNMSNPTELMVGMTEYRLSEITKLRQQAIIYKDGMQLNPQEVLGKYFEDFYDIDKTDVGTDLIWSFISRLYAGIGFTTDIERIGRNHFKSQSIYHDYLFNLGQEVESEVGGDTVTSVQPSADKPMEKIRQNLPDIAFDYLSRQSTEFLFECKGNLLRKDYHNKDNYEEDCVDMTFLEFLGLVDDITGDEWRSDRDLERMVIGEIQAYLVNVLESQTDFGHLNQKIKLYLEDNGVSDRFIEIIQNMEQINASKSGIDRSDVELILNIENVLGCNLVVFGNDGIPMLHEQNINRIKLYLAD